MQKFSIKVKMLFKKWLKMKVLQKMKKFKEN